MSKTWYQIQAKSNEGKATADISIHDEIGMWGVSASQFMADVKALGPVDEINLSIHSPGGDVLDGWAIYNALRSNKARVNVQIEGLAASMASVIAMAADKITMHENSFMMIHEPWGMAIGDAEEMRDTADLLDKLGNGLVNAYVDRTGNDEETIRGWMKAETWMDGKEAKARGFADEVTGKVALSAKIDTRRFKMTPQSLTQNSDSTPIVATVEGTPPDAPVEPTAPVDAQVENPAVEPVAPVVTESEPAPQASLIQRAIAALTGRPDSGAIQAKLDEANALVATLQATNASLTARISELEPLAKEREELLNAIQTAEQLAAAQIAQAGFTPASEQTLPQATNAQAKSKLEQFAELTGEERTAFYNANREELTKFIQTPSPSK